MRGNIIPVDVYYVYMASVQKVWTALIKTSAQAAASLGNVISVIQIIKQSFVGSLHFQYYFG